MRPADARLRGRCCWAGGPGDGPAEARWRRASDTGRRLAEWRRHELVFDDSIEGERLRRHSTACDRLLQRTIATFLKVRKAGETPEFDTLEPVEQAATREAVDQQRAWRFKDEPTATSTASAKRTHRATSTTLRKTNPPPLAAGQDPQIEPTADNTAHDPQDQSSADFGICPTNPATTTFPDLQNEPTDHDGSTISKTNPPTTTSTIFKTNPRSTIKIPKRNPGLAMGMTTRLKNGWR